MKITIIGTGYVGLVSGVCFAKIGHNVTCVDKDPNKIFKLENGQIPIFEPGLKEILQTSKNNITFTTSIEEGIKESDVIFIAVGTPQGENEGSANLDFVFEVAKDIAKYANSYKAIVTKSTVPVGTGKKIEKIIKENNPNLEFSIISNPEFLREGKAIDDFLNPDRVVVGINDDKSKKIMMEIYQPLCNLNQNQNLAIYTDVTTSELIKYGANSFLATKIAFINEMANLCEKVGANVKDFSKGIGTDSRIGDKFLNPGPGFGGSCFPKDILALNAVAKENNVNLSIIDSIISSNSNRKLEMAQRIIKILDNNVKNKEIAVLGLAFKGDTDDIRYSPAIAIIKELLKEGAKIQAFDPEAMENTQNELKNDNISYHQNPYEASKDAEILVIATEWEEFKDLDLDKLKTNLKNPTIIDLRNLLNPKIAKDKGFKYFAIGSSS